MPELATNRILMLAGQMDFRGSAFRTGNLARKLMARGHQVEVVLWGGQLLPWLEEHQVPVYFSPVVRRGWGSPLALASLKRHAASWRPQVIDVQGPRLSGLGGKLAKAARCPYVVTVNTYADDPVKIQLKRPWGRGVVAVSQDVREDLVNLGGLPKESVVVVHDGVEVADYEPFRRLNQAHRVPVVGMVARMAPVKGQEDFLRAAKRLLAAGRKLEFVIAGSGPDEQRLRGLARELVVDREVTFVPPMPDHRAILGMLDLLVVPSRHEGLGLIILEALACGKPVVATGVGGVFAIVKDGETGLLVPKEDPVALADGIGRLLDDPALAQRLAAKGREFVEQEFSLNQTVDETLAHYDRVTSEEAG